MLYIEPKEHKRIILTDTHSGNCTIIALEYHRGHLSLGFSAPDAVRIKHIVSNTQLKDSPKTGTKEKYHNDNAKNQKTI